MKANFNKYLKIRTLDRNIGEYDYIKFYEIDTLPVLGINHQTGIETVAVNTCGSHHRSGLERLEGDYQFYEIEYKDLTLDTHEGGYIFYEYYYTKEE